MNELVIELQDLLNKYSRENKSNTPDFILAEYMLAALELFEFTSRRREQWYGGKLVPARTEGPWVEPDETGMYSNVVFDLDPKKYD